MHVVVTMLFDTNTTNEAYRGQGGIFENAKPGTALENSRNWW